MAKIRIELLSVIAILSAVCPLPAESVQPDSASKTYGGGSDGNEYKKGDMMIWQNMLAAYKNTRDIATESKLSMTKVRNFAAAGNKLLMSINSISAQVGEIWEKTSAYNRIFGRSDTLWNRYLEPVEHNPEVPVADERTNKFKDLGVTDIDVRDYRRDMSVVRNDIINFPERIGENMLNVRSGERGYNAFAEKYKKSAEETATDARVYRFASMSLDSGGSGAVRRYVVASNAAMGAVAAAGMRNAEIDAEALPSVVMMVNPAPGIRVKKGAIDTRTLTRNRIAADLRGVEAQQAAVSVMGQILMSKLTGVDGKLYQSANQAFIFSGYKDTICSRLGGCGDEND